MALFERRGRAALPRRLLAALGRGRGAQGVGRRCTELRRAGAGHRQDREPIRLAALSDLDGPQSYVRRRGARVLGQRRRGSEAHESHPRRQRARQDVPRRARRQLLRSLPSLAHEQDPALDRYGRSGLGRARRQRARPRRRLHGHRIPRPLRRALRHGGRAADGRGRAHGHGRQPAGQDLAAVQVRLGSVGRRHFLAVELRHRDEDGFLAHGGTGGRAAGRGYRAEAPRRRAARRHVAQLDVRAHGAVAGQRREPANGRQQRRDAAVARLGRGIGRAVGPVSRRVRAARRSGPRSSSTTGRAT